MTKLWGGRFQKKTDERFERFSASFIWDHRLLAFDLEIDVAQTKALLACGILSKKESQKLLSAIKALQVKAAKGLLRLDPGSEDVHSAVQSELKKIAGDVADKIHTGRSRNDLVAQSSRLYTKHSLEQIDSQLQKLQKALLAKAGSSQSLLLPGMTHLQPAQVLSQAHIFLSYIEMFERDREQLAAAKKLSDVCVLGSGALAGTTFALDQKKIARDLGLSSVTRNSYDVSGDRDFVQSALYTTLGIGIHLSRIAEDWMIGQTKGYFLVDIDQAFCTGSSMMPQKKNADFAELTRGASGVFAANFLGLLTTLKGLPTSYNRDLQWDKKHLFDSIENCLEVLDIFTRMTETIVFRKDRAAELLKDESLYATDLADYLAKKGVPFKKAHDQVGRIVDFAESQKVAISKIGLDILQNFSPAIDGDVYDLFSPENSVRLKRTAGSTHPLEVKKQISYWTNKLRKS